MLFIISGDSLHSLRPQYCQVDIVFTDTDRELFAAHLIDSYRDI